MSTHSSTCTQRPPVANYTPQQTWPPCWTGASQNPQPLNQGRCLGFPASCKRSMIIPCGANIWRSGPNSLPTSPTGSETTPARTKRSLCGRRRAAARTSPSLLKSPCGGPPTASTPTTHDQPEQHSCRQLRRSGNTTSTEVSPAAATTTSVVLTSQSASLLEPHVIAGTKIDSGCPNHPRSARTRHPAPAYRSPRQPRVRSHQIHDGQKASPGRPPTAKSGSQIKSGAPRRRSTCPRFDCSPLRWNACASNQ